MSVEELTVHRAVAHDVRALHDAWISPLFWWISLVLAVFLVSGLWFVVLQHLFG